MKSVSVALCLVIFALTGCGDSAPPKSLKDVTRNIVQTSSDDGWLIVVLRSQGLDGGESDMTRVALDIQDIGAWQMAHGGGVEAGLSVVVSIPTQDKYGNEGVVDSLRISISGADLNLVNWKNISHWDLMNLAVLVFEHPFGRQLAAKWCIDEQNFKYSQPFCGKVVKS